MSEYPEHEKLRALDGRNQAVGCFIEWLQVKGYVIARYKNIHGFMDEQLVPDTSGIQDLIAEYFGIDQDKLEQEKRKMLDDLRSQYPR
jgi:hypothetical protein